jgi:hypothetical protein
VNSRHRTCVTQCRFLGVRFHLHCVENLHRG